MLHRPFPHQLRLWPAGAADTGAAAHARRRGLAASLPLYAVERADVIQDATFLGAVRQALIQDIFFGATGRVKEIYVRSGDDVLVDQTLAELEHRDLEFDLQKAQLDLKLAEQRAVDTDIDFRFEQLARQIELQRAKLRLAQFQANPSSASADIAIQELAVKQAELALQQMESGVGPGGADRAGQGADRPACHPGGPGRCHHHRALLPGRVPL